MNEENTSDAAQTDEAAAADVAAFLQAEDPLLNMLLHYAELGAGAGVTLIVNGLVVTGRLVSQRSYMEKSYMKLDEVKSFVARIYKVIIESSEKEDADPLNLPAASYRYIHLEDAAIYQDSTRPLTAGGTLMRIRQSEVSGWHVGTVE